jgi:hypothetical protein
MLAPGGEGVNHGFSATWPADVITAGTSTVVEGPQGGIWWGATEAGRFAPPVTG